MMYIYVCVYVYIVVSVLLFFFSFLSPSSSSFFFSNLFLGTSIFDVYVCIQLQRGVAVTWSARSLSPPFLSDRAPATSLQGVVFSFRPDSLRPPLPFLSFLAR